MKAQLDEISPKAARGGAHAALVLDPAGWHTTDKPKVPRNITVIQLPSRLPELIWGAARENMFYGDIFAELLNIFQILGMGPMHERLVNKPDPTYRDR